MMKAIFFQVTDNQSGHTCDVATLYEHARALQVSEVEYVMVVRAGYWPNVKLDPNAVSKWNLHRKKFLKKNPGGKRITMTACKLAFDAPETLQDSKK